MRSAGGRAGSSFAMRLVSTAARSRSSAATTPWSSAATAPGRPLCSRPRPGRAWPPLEPLLVVAVEHRGRARLLAVCLLEDRTELLPKRLELLVGGPDLAHLEV